MVGRAVHAHPVAVLLGVTAGGVLAGIIGAMLAAPIVAVAAAILGYLRERSDAAESSADGLVVPHADARAKTSKVEASPSE